MTSRKPQNTTLRVGFPLLSVAAALESFASLSGFIFLFLSLSVFVFMFSQIYLCLSVSITHSPFYFTVFEKDVTSQSDLSYVPIGDRE